MSPFMETSRLLLKFFHLLSLIENDPWPHESYSKHIFIIWKTYLCLRVRAGLIMLQLCSFFLSFQLVRLSSDNPTKGNGAAIPRSLSRSTSGLYSSSRRQTKSWRYELCSQTIIAFSFVLFILLSLLCLQAAAKEGKAWGKGMSASLQPHIKARSSCTYFLKNLSSCRTPDCRFEPVRFALRRNLAKQLAFLFEA